MLAAIRRLLSRMTGKSEEVTTGDDEVRLAIAALLFHVIAVDGTVLEEERTALIELLERRFELSPDEARALVAAAEVADAEAVDLYAFTSVIKRDIDQAERERLIGMMWKMVYADGKVHEFQDNVVWRVAELLGVPSQTRIRLKQSVRGNGG
jgi:uncharacterized tellurite resistance protein B-like protein